MSVFADPVNYTPDGVALFGDDSRLLVKFFKHPQISKIKSEEAGRPVYDDVIMVEVIQPGEKEPVRQLANDMHRARFPKQWENFQKGMADITTGTPLDHLFPNEPGTILTLNGFNIFTVEQLAGITDTAIGNIPMGRTLCDRARQYISTAAGGATFHKMEQQIAELTRRLEEMSAAPVETAEPRKRGPGRPPNPKPIEGAAQ